MNTRLHQPIAPAPLLLMVLTLTLTLQGCDGDAPSADTPTAEMAIAMSGVTDSAPEADTRAVGDGEFLLDNAALQAAGFGVYCWYTGQKSFEESSESPADSKLMLMRNQKVTYDATATQWTYSPAKYWPLDDRERLTLRAYAPYTPYVYEDNGGLPLLPVIVNEADFHNGTQHDPLFGTSYEGRLYTDITRPTTTTEHTQTNTVNWYFHHGMAKILFRGLVSTDYQPNSDNYELRITSIKLSPLYDHGLLDVSQSTATSHTDKPVWQQKSGTMSVTLSDDDLRSVNLYNKTNTYSELLDKGLLIIPRDYSGEDNELQLTITYKTKNPEGEKSVTGSISQHLHGNTVYTIQLLLNPTSSTVNVILSVDLNWQTGSYTLIDGL